jgi:hypothetical protein
MFSLAALAVAAAFGGPVAEPARAPRADHATV